MKTAAPKDFYQPYAEYVALRGDPQTNGLGHTREKFKGMDCVKMPGANLWEVSREEEEACHLERTMDDSHAIHLGENQLQQNFEDLGASHFAAFPEASGQALSLDVLLGLSASSSSAGSSGEHDGD